MMKVFEIGSEYDWDSTFQYISKEKNNKFQQTENSIFKFLRSGRDALRYIAKAYKKEKSAVLMPALCCSCMPEPFEDEEYEIIYYKLKDTLEVDVEDVLKKIKDDSIFLFMNYFAIPSLKSEELEKIVCSRKNIISVEDITHDFLNRDLKEGNADITICSIRKWFSIADGGIIFSKNSVPYIQLEKDDFFSKNRMEAMKIKSEYLKIGDIAQKNKFREKLAISNEYIDNIKNLIEMNEESKKSLVYLNLDGMYKERLNNSKFLFDNIKKIKKIKTLGIESVNSTLYFPIVVSDQKEIQQKLAQNGVYAPVIWPLPEKAIGICKVADKLANQMLAIPCDHRYSKREMSKVVEILDKIINEI